MAQELYREANTINSKAQDIAITKESLAIKGELESIRQHVRYRVALEVLHFEIIR